MIASGTLRIIGAVYYFNRRNLAVCVLVHGLYNMVGLTLIYLGQGDALRRLAGG